MVTAWILELPGLDCVIGACLALLVKDADRGCVGDAVEYRGRVGEATEDKGRAGDATADADRGRVGEATKDRGCFDDTTDDRDRVGEARADDFLVVLVFIFFTLR